MTPLWNQRPAPQPARPKWKVADQRTKLPKCQNTAPRHVVPSYTFSPRKYPVAYGHFESALIDSCKWEEPVTTGYHRRHAKASPVRPHIVTVVRPCGEHTLRKISLLLNRRAVQTFELLMADMSEALGFPSWSNGRVRRLFSPAGREIRSLSDFFYFDHAFLAFGNSRPSIGEVQAALNELYPDNICYRDNLLRLWERILRPKETKADSGFHDDDAQVDILQNSALSPGQTQPAANNLQPVRSQGRQKDRDRRERQDRELEHWRGDVKAQTKEERTPERRKEPQYCRSCRGAGPPIPPIGSRQWAKWEEPNDKSKGHPTQNSRLANPSKRCQPLQKVPANNVNNDQNTTENKVISETLTEKPTEQNGFVAEMVHKSNWHQKLPPDDEEVTQEEIERYYDIGCVLGDGNFAVVRECSVRGYTQTFAMKMVDKAKLQGRAHMIQNEIALLRSLAHPRLVRLLRTHHTSTHVYLLMELVTGGDLFDAIAQSGRFSEPCAACMIHDISQALEYIHNKSIAHRDIKPENLLVQRHGNGSVNLKLADFGLAMVVTEPVFTVCGTPTYVAPEILAETGYGMAVDVWAMGVILFVLLSGFPPFRSPDRNQEELFRLIQKGEFDFISPFWDHVSEGAKVLIRALLEVDPAIRLTASQTLQNSWLLQAVTQSDHKGEVKASQQRVNKKSQSNREKDERDQAKPDISVETVQAAQMKKNREEPRPVYNKEKNINQGDKLALEKSHARKTSNNDHILDVSVQQADLAQSSTNIVDFHCQDQQSNNTENRTSTINQETLQSINVTRESQTRQQTQHKQERTSEIRHVEGDILTS